MTRRRRRRAELVGLALGLALGLLPTLAPEPAAAATPSLTISSVTTYDVLPAEGRVAVTAQLTATNHLRNTVTRNFYFRTAFLTVQPGTTDFTLTGGGGKPAVSIHEATDTSTSLKLDFGANLGAGKSTHLTLHFDIRDAGGDATRPVRVSRSLVTFAAWAFATPSTPGSTVLVQLPTGYRVTIGRGPLSGPTTDGAGHDQWSSGRLEAPLDFVADITADRPTGYLETPMEVQLGAAAAPIVVRSWPDDKAWADRVSNLVQHALPILEREIGVAWPVDGSLEVNEVLVRGSGFAGVFDPQERRIDISYAASDEVVIHELAHAWFNGRLVADLWTAEGFASYYGDLAARELGLEVGPPQPIEPGVVPLPLNAWDPGADATPAAQAYAYAASLQVARDIAERAGADGLRTVWALAARGIGAYRPEPTAEEPVAGAPDWRGLLDLLEDETGQDYDDLWRRWVARPEDLTALDARATARIAYLRAVQSAGDWHLPATIREAMRSWRFDMAQERINAAAAILGERSTLAAAAEAVGVSLPDSLREAFEGPDGLTAAAAEAASEHSAVEMLAAAADARPDDAGFLDGLVIGIGLLFQDPADQLATAGIAFESGNVGGAYDAALLARDAWRYAAAAGRWRIVSLLLFGLSLGLFAWIARQRRRRTAGVARAARAA